MKEELADLQKDHDTFLKAAAAKKKAGTASLADFSDTSVPNLSSVVVLAEAGGKSILLTGDARGDKILTGLELIGAITPKGKLHVDVLKMPHHGSDRNMENRSSSASPPITTSFPEMARMATPSARR
jgi:hypothetical protein